MAMSIKMVPVLMGQSAVDFVSAADANSKNLPPELTPEREEQIHNILEKSKNFTIGPRIHQAITTVKENS